MPEIRNTFVLGKMNKDADNRLIGEGQYRHAENIRVANSEGSDVGAIEKTLSNTQLTSLSLGEDITTLGELSDEFDEKIYWAIKSSIGCFIVEYNTINEAVAFVLYDSRIGDLNVLNFNVSKRLQMVLIIDSDNENRLLAFTDNNTQPKMINVDRAKGYGINGFNEEMILLIKKPPIYSPTLTLGNTGSEENNIKEKFLCFSYRYKYLDGEYSALSPYTVFGFEPEIFNYDYSTQVNESMVNNFNKITIGFNVGNDLVTDVEIVFKESGNNNLYVVERFNKADKGWTDDSNQAIDFENNKISRVLPEKELYRFYDNVPLLAKAITVINNQIVFGNYTENFDLIDGDEKKITLDLTASLVETAIDINTPEASLKSIRDYEIAIGYLEDYGRETTPLISENNTVYIPNSNCVTKNEIKVVIANQPPSFAKYFRFFIKQNKVDYDIVIPTLFYQDGVFVWIRLDGGNKDKVKEGDFLYVKADSQGILDDLKEVKVLEVEDQDSSFLGGDELSGLYFKIKTDGFRIDENDFTNYKYSTSTMSLSLGENVIVDNYNKVEDPVYYGTVAGGLNDLASDGPYTGGVDKRFLVDIFSEGIKATGTVELTGGASGSVDGITVDGIAIMSGSELFDTDLNTTALNVANNINLNTSVPNYTAVAVGPIITITAEDLGTGPNTFVVTSIVTTITSTDVNMSGGTVDNFRWSVDDGATWDDNTGAGYDITTGPQLLSNGVRITFASDTGHLETDQWIVSAKSQYDNGLGGEESSRSYAIIRGIDSDIIEGGAVISIYFYESGDSSITFSESWISSTRYANLEEWFYRDNIIDDFVAAGISDDRIWFRRGVVGSVFGGLNNFTQTGDGAMCMLIKTENSEDGTFDSDTVRTTSVIKIFQSEQNIVLETKPKDTNTDLFYEIGQTYAITGGYHIGNGGDDVDQTAIADAEIILPVHNCFSWGNGVESYKIKDTFNSNTMKMDTRPSVTVEEYKKNVRIADFTWSQEYEQTTNYNALNEFNLSLINFSSLDDKYGSIQRMVAWNTDLDIWQEDKVHKVYYDKQLIYNVDGSNNLAKSDSLFNGVLPYSGEYGISKNAESLVVYGNYTYWADAKRGVWLRKGRSGIEVISNFGMRDWFKDAFRNGDTDVLLSCYDPYFGQLVININGYTLTFDEKVKGWTSFHSYLPDGMARMNNRFYSIKNGNIWLHNDVTNGYLQYYGVSYDAKIVSVFNQEFQFDKIFKTIVLESESAWAIAIVTNLTNSTIAKSEFNQRESRWFAHTRKNEDSANLRGVSQGIGNITVVDSGLITFDAVNPMVSIGDTLIQMNGSTQEIIGVITDSSTTTLTVDTIVETPVVGRFAFAKKVGRIEGAEIRGYYAEVTLTDNANSKNEIFAISCNAVKSYI